MMSPPTAAISSSLPAWRCRLNRRWESSTWKWWQTRAFTTEAKGPRRIKRLVNDEEALERMAARVAAQPDKLAQRKALIEHPFGTLKRSWHHGYFLLRTLPKVTTEFSLSVLTYNLRRALNILG